MPQVYNSFVVNAWEQYDIGSAYDKGVTREQLERAVSRAAKAANSRLRRLERRGYTKYAYKSAMQNLDGRKRFFEYTSNKTIQQLRAEYGRLRDFISRPTSTIQGIQNIRVRWYQTAVERGFTGTQDEFERLVRTYFTEVVESLFSSDVIYESITTGRTDVIDEIMKRYKNMERDSTTRGRVLLEYLRRTKERK